MTQVVGRDGVTEAEWPSPADVRADLVALRRGYGVRYESMHLAPRLQQLRVVRNEALRQRRDLAEHAPYIAYDVLRCVANSDHSAQYFGAQAAEVLGETLNFAQSATSLEQRRQVLREKFHLSHDSYEDLEERTFQQLAGHLLSLEVAPCYRDENLPKALAEMLEHWREFGDREAAHLLEMGFLRLVSSRTHEEALEEASRILESIPRGVNFAATRLGADSSDPELQLGRLLQGISREFFSAWLRSRGIPVSDIVRGWYLEAFFSAVQVRGFALSNLVLEDLASRRLEVLSGETPDQHLAAARNELQFSLVVMSLIVVDLEQQNSWKLILPESGASSALAPARPSPVPLA